MVPCIMLNDRHFHINYTLSVLITAIQSFTIEEIDMFLYRKGNLYDIR